MSVSFKSFTGVGIGTSNFGRETQLMGDDCIDEEISGVESVIGTDGKDKDLLPIRLLVFCSLILMRFGISDSLLVLLFAFDEGQSNMPESDVT